ncbi:MAG: recombination regulator RecX [Actinomycetota bacterium]|nr:recombination regulator RecX [Actinomycetota bacterium]
MGTTQHRAGRRDRGPAAADHDPGSAPHADPESVARKILLDRLSAQPRTRHELAETLSRKLVPDEVARRLLDRFEEVGLVDDAAFARSWVESRQSGRGLARRALAQELRRKGVPDEVAREALDAIDPDDETEAARALVRRKLRTMGRLDHQARMRRLTAMLARKGYPPGVAFSVVRDELADAGEAGELSSFGTAGEPDPSPEET